MAERDPGLWDSAAPADTSEVDVEPAGEADDAHGETQDAALGAAARHALHDEELIVAYADGSAEADEAVRATALVARCSICRDLHADVVAITAVIKASGTSAEVAAVRPAPRDFRLTPEMLGLARRRTGLAGIAERVAELIRSFGRPMGASLAALGVVGMLAGTLGLGGPGLLSFGAASAPGGQPAPGATAGADTGELGPTSSERTSVAQPFATDGTEIPGGPAILTQDGSSAATWLFGGSLVLVVVGSMLFVLGTRGRRKEPRNE